MGRGFLAGIFWGGLVGVALLLVSAQVLDRQELSLPQPEAVPVEVPAGTEFDQARPETEPVAPAEETRPAEDAVSGVIPPDDMGETPPSFDTSSLEVPTPAIEAPGGLGEVPEVAEGVQIDVTGPASEAPSGDNSPALAAPEAPASAPDTVTEAPEAVPAPEPEAEDAPAVVEVDDAPAPEPAPAPDATTEIETPVAPEATETAEAPAPAEPEAPEAAPAPEAETDAPTVIASDGGDSGVARPTEETAPTAPAPSNEALPQIGTDPSGESEDLPSIIQLEGEDEGETAILDLPSDDDPMPDNAPALLRNRIPFENTTGQPLMSVVLLHEGASPLSDTQLAQMPASVALAIEAGNPAAADIASAYRAAGREVVMIPSLPAGATPQDVEVALRVNFETIPDAVAVMDASGEAFQSDRAAVAQIVDVVTATGHGLVTFPRGLNTAHQRAQRAGVPTGLIFRDIDGGGETSDQIRRAMDRAAFRARQDEAVILVGRAQAETIGALIDWMTGNRADSVTLAPISAALLANN